MSATTSTINDLHVRSFGPADAPLAIVFLHYWGGTARTWDKTIESTLRAHPDVRAVAYDTRGWGASSKPENDKSAYTISGLATDAAKLIAQLEPQPKRVVLVGHSMGGKIAQLLAARWGKEATLPTLAGLVLVAPAPPTPINLPEENLQQLLHAYDSPESIQLTVEHVLSGNGWESLGEGVGQQIVEDSLAGGDLARSTWPRHAMPEDIQSEVAEGLNGKGVPILVVGAELDKVEPVKLLQEKVVPKLEGAELVILPGVGHLIPLEAGDKLGAHISAFVDKI